LKIGEEKRGAKMKKNNIFLQSPKDIEVSCPHCKSSFWMSTLAPQSYCVFCGKPLNVEVEESDKKLSQNEKDERLLKSFLPWCFKISPDKERIYCELCKKLVLKNEEIAKEITIYDMCKGQRKVLAKLKK